MANIFMYHVLKVNIYFNDLNQHKSIFDDETFIPYIYSYMNYALYE